MSMITVQIPAMQARKSFGQLLELAHYANKTFAITRKDKPMAWLVGGDLFKSIFKLLAEDKELQDTLAILLDTELQAAMSQGELEYSTRKNLVSVKNL